MRYHLQVSTCMSVREIIVSFGFCFVFKKSQMGLHIIGYHFKDPNKGKTEHYMRYID